MKRVYEICVVDLEIAKKNAIWCANSNGDNNNFVRLIDCSTDHLNNILLNVKHLEADYRVIIKSILADRAS